MEFNDIEVSYAQSAFTQKMEGFLLYNNTDYGFQLRYAQNWIVTEGFRRRGFFLILIFLFIITTLSLLMFH
jgi:hypothetical protein